MRNKIIPYNPKLKKYARKLRKAGVLSEVILWKSIRKKALDVEFHRQVPIDNYIVGFYCHELMLVIEIDGSIHELEDVRLNDFRRQKRLEGFGIKFIRFSDFDVKNNLEFVLRELEVKIKELRVSPVNAARTSPSKGTSPSTLRGRPLRRGNNSLFGRGMSAWADGEMSNPDNIKKLIIK